MTEGNSFTDELNFAPIGLKEKGVEFLFDVTFKKALYQPKRPYIERRSNKS